MSEPEDSKPEVSEPEASEPEDRARRLLSRVPLLDGHNDLPWALREVAGVDHVGLGGDFDGTDQLPDGMADVSCYPALLGELLRRGWAEDDCAKLAGGNILRVLRDAEAAARELSGQRPPSTARIEDLDGP